MTDGGSKRETGLRKRWNEDGEDEAGTRVFSGFWVSGKCGEEEDREERESEGKGVLILDRAGKGK